MRSFYSVLRTYSTALTSKFVQTFNYLELFLIINNNEAKVKMSVIGSWKKEIEIELVNEELD